MLADAACAVDTWEITYMHELTGAPGTCLNRRHRPGPREEHLGDEGWHLFSTESILVLADTYPVRSDGRTLFLFRRIVVVAWVK